MDSKLSTMEKAIGRRKAPAEGADFGKWLKTRLEEKGGTLAALAREVGADYSYLWKVIQCDPSRYPTNIRTGYEVTMRLGEYFGDVEGAMRAAGYQMPEAPTTERDPLLNQLATLPPERWEIIRALLLSWSEEPPQPS